MKKLFSLVCLAVLCVSLMVASDAFRLHRYDMFHALPVRSTDIVMMGNSITDMPIWPEFFAGAQGRVINRGNSGGFSYEMRDNMMSVLLGKPAKIFMKIGTNDLGGNTGTPESIAANVRKCVEMTKAYSPNTEFYIESILPAKNQNSKTPETIAAANVLLKAIADEDPNDKCYWVELNSLFGGKVTTLPANTTLDQLHLSAGGYKIWCDAIVGNMGSGASVVLPSNIATTQKTCGLGHPNGTRNTYYSGVPVENDNILVIGDEMIKCGEWQELLGNDKVLNRGYGWGYGGSISVINTSLEAIFNGGTPKAVYLYTGTADLNNGASALSNNKTAYTTLINNIKTRMNGGKIVLLGNQPINDANINANSIKPFNEWLASQAAADEQLEYVDLYTPFVNAGTNNMNTRYLTQGDGKAYLYGLGYAKVAELMKPTLDAITGLNNDVVTEVEAEAQIALYNAATKKLKGGDGLGEYPTALVEAANAAAEALQAAIAGGNAEQIAAKVQAYNEAMAALNGKLNMPTAENTTGKQFWMYTPKRSSRYAIGTESGVGCAATNEDYATYRWELVARTDGKFDLKNVGTGTYADPSTTHDTQMKMSATPGAGWDFQESDGYYIITSGTNAEFNMSNNSNMIVYNWYNNFPNLTDDGCKFAIVEAEGEPKEEPTPEPLEGDRYYIRSQFNSGSNLYLINNNGAVATSATKPADEKGQWIITDSQIRNAAGGKYLGVDKGFKLYAEAHTLAIGEGTTADTKSVAESNKYGAVKTDGTVDGGQFTGSKQADYQGWTTNLVFEAVEGPGPDPKPEGTYTVDKDHGSLLRDGSTAGQTWNNTWKSTDGMVTFTASANNMQWNGNNIDARSGGSKSSTYTLSSTSSKYVIKNYGFKAKALSTNNQTWAQGGKTYTVTSAAETTIAGSDVEERTVQFVLTGENTGTLLTEFTVELEEVQVDPTLTEPEVVTVLKNAGSAVPYRIPAIASTKDGVLVVAADYRFTKADIGGGRLDLHLRRSFDYGKTWEEEYIKPENMMGDGNCSGGNDYAGFGDPCIVADRESNKMMILSCSGYPGFWSCTREQHQRCARWYSEDNGATWTGPEFIDNKFVFEPFDNHSFGPAQGMFFGSGKIHQSRYYKKDQYYRLYASNSVRNSSAVRNYVMYSDDFGLTWNFLGGIDAPAVNSAGDEPKVEELPDGSVLFSGRVNGGGGRNINIFKFTDIAKGQGAWMGCVKSNASNAGVTNDNACNGEIQLVPVVRKKDNKKMWLALQSVPFGSGRNNVGIFYKGLEDEEAYKNPTAVASNWEGKHQASWASSAYSTMVVQGNKHIGFVYEENGANGGYDIQYKDYTVEVLTDGKYSYDTEYDPETTVLPLSAGVITPSAGTVEKVETITVSFNKPVTAKVSTTTLAEGVSAAVAAEGNTLTLTLASAITEKGVYELTVPAGVVVDADKQENSAVSVKYRILGEALELGAEVTSLDGIDEHKTYALYNPASTAYAMYAPQYNSSVLWVAGMKDMDASHKVSNPSYSDAPNFADPNLAWAVVNYNGEKYLFNVGAEMFVTVGRPTTLARAPRAIKIEKVSNGFAFNTTGGAQDYMCASPQLSEPIAVWTSSDAGSCWQLMENPNVEDSYELAMKYLNPEGIQAAINGSAVQTQTFDLMGRRVSGLAGRGIYIMGDRKVMR